MAPQAIENDGIESRRDVMGNVAEGMQECGFPARDAEEWEFGGIAEKPDFANIARTVQTDSAFQAFKVPSAGDSVFGEHSGQSVVTARIVKNGLSIKEAIKELDSDGHIERALNAVYERVGDKREALDIAQYLIFLFAKGWVAERVAQTTDRFAKMSESSDIGGQDFYDSKIDEYVQLKSVSYGYKALQGSGSRGNMMDEKDNPVVFYQYDDNGGIHFGRDHTEVNGKASEVAEVKKTDMWKHLLWV